MAAMADIASAQQHAREANKLEVLDAATAAELDAITSQIIPSVDGPGAREVGAVYFIDRVLATFEADKRDAYRKGMNEIEQLRSRMFPQSSSIAKLTDAEQIALLQAVEKTDFFEVVRVHTLLGFLGSPAYGGNRDQVGWRYIEFEDRMTWQPPFGHYDAESK